MTMNYAEFELLGRIAHKIASYHGIYAIIRGICTMSKGISATVSHLYPV